MTLIDAALSRSRMVLAIFVFLFIAGSSAYVSIPKEADPDVNIPIIFVSTALEGISPEDSERLLVRPLEKELKSVEGLKEMRATAYEGGSNITLEFDAGFDVDKALEDVREKVDIVQPDLPDDADEPIVGEVNLSLFPIFIVSLYGDVPERTLLQYARRLQDQIEGISTVLEAEIKGERDETLEIIIDPIKLENYNLQPVEITQKLQQDNQLVAAGAIDTGAGRFSIKVPGLFENVNDVLNAPLVSSGEGIVRVRDVASVRRTFKDATLFARLDGERALAIEVSKRVGTNIIETVENVRMIVEEETKNWPETIKVKFSQDKSTQIRNMLTDLQNNVITAVLLVLIVIVAILGVRGGVLVGLAIPGSFLTALLLLYVLGYTINIVVLFALILSVGMLVDGAIVVSEYADRKIREGLLKSSAYGLAARRMALPIMASTATTLAAFAPLLFWPGIVGEFMIFLPITLIMALSASLVMALIFLPTLGTNLITVAKLIFGGGAFIGSIIIINQIATGLLGFGEAQSLLYNGIGVIIGLYAAWKMVLFINWITKTDTTAPPVKETEQTQPTLSELLNFKGPVKYYLRLINTCLSITPIIALLALGMLAGTWVSYIVFGKGVEFFPDIEPDQLLVNVHARGNLSTLERDKLVHDVETIILDYQDQTYAFKSIDTTSGIFPVRDSEAEDIIGKIRLELQEWDQRPSANKIKQALREQARNFAGIIVEIREPEAGPPTGKPLHIELASENPDLLLEPTSRIRAFFDQMDGLEDIEDSRPIPGIEWKLSVDREQATKFDVNVGTLGGFVRMVTRGFKLDSYRPNDADEEIDILLRMPSEYRTLDQLDNIRILTNQGPIPVGNFISRSGEQKTGQLRRIDGKRIMYVKADVAEGILAETKLDEVRAWMDQQTFPQGVDYRYRGENEEQEKASAFLGKAFAVALFLIAVILVTQFNSFYSTLLILTAIIMSTVGVLGGLLITGQPFGIVMSGIGVIALAGIVVNNNIILIDTYDRLKREVGDTRTAIILTCYQRIRPVLLTTFTTILGLLPMTFQVNIDFVTREITQGSPSTQWWVSLSTAIVFGLSFASILTLIVTPCLLKLPADLKAIFAWIHSRLFNKPKKHDFTLDESAHSP